MILGQRIRLDPNNVQATWLERCAGTARFTWNWGLARWKVMHEAGEKPNWHKLSLALNATKGVEFPWMAELPWAITSVVLSDLGDAFAHFFRRVKAKGTQKPGYPRLKKKGRCREGFAIEGRAVRFDGKRVKVPKLGWLRTRQELRFPGKILSARFSKAAGHWYVSVQVEVDGSWVYPHRCETQAVVGVDLGVKDLAVLSTGERIEAPRSLRRHELQLRRLNKELARRKKGGANWKKTKARLAKLHQRVADVRRDVTHNLTARLVTDFRVICVEDLNVTGMAKNRCLAKSVADAAMSEVVRQINYKAPLAGSAVAAVDRWFPSSKTCHICGVIRDALPLSVRTWICEGCGATHDRDVNAALNILAAAQAVTAQCQGSSGGPVRRAAKLPSGWEPGIQAVS